MSKVKLKDIAHRAGVSMMTVSRVMNNDVNVGVKTRERVSAMAVEMGYQPNLAARHLASDKSFLLGIVCEFASASYVNKFLLGCLSECRQSGYHAVIDETHNQEKRTTSVINNFANMTQVDGVVLLPPVADDPVAIKALQDANLPFVRVGPSDHFDISPCILMDDYRAAYEMTQHLIDQGKRSIAHIVGQSFQRVSQLRLKGYQDALLDNGLEINPDYQIQGDFTFKSALDQTTSLLANYKHPDAIFAANDDMAAGALAAARVHKLSVPQDLAIAGFDDIELATIVWPNLSTVEQPIEKMARVAVNILTGDAKANEFLVKGNTRRYLLKHRIKLRDSTKS